MWVILAMLHPKNDNTLAEVEVYGPFSVKSGAEWWRKEIRKRPWWDSVTVEPLKDV